VEQIFYLVGYFVSETAIGGQHWVNQVQAPESQHSFHVHGLIVFFSPGTMLRAFTVFRTLTPFNFLMTPCFFG
jgi:hypothetical protein